MILRFKLAGVLLMLAWLLPSTVSAYLTLKSSDGIQVLGNSIPAEALVKLHFLQVSQELAVYARSHQQPNLAMRAETNIERLTRELQPYLSSPSPANQHQGHFKPWLKFGMSGLLLIMGGFGFRRWLKAHQRKRERRGR